MALHDKIQKAVYALGVLCDSKNAPAPEIAAESHIGG